MGLCPKEVIFFQAGKLMFKEVFQSLLTPCLSFEGPLESFNGEKMGRQ